MMAGAVMALLNPLMMEVGAAAAAAVKASLVVESPEAVG